AARAARSEAVAADHARRQERAAQKAREHAARLLYDADLQLAAQEWEGDRGSVRRAQELLAAHVPRPGEPELRDFAWRYQWTLMNDAAVTFAGHAGGVGSGAFSSDGHLLTLDGAHCLRWWDVGTQRPVRTLDLW